MRTEDPRETLSVIRTLMERGTRYQNLSGLAGVAAGVFTLLGCGIRVQFGAPLLPTWLGVLAAALAASVYFTLEMARANGEPLWTRQARTVVLALLPAFIAALALSAALQRAGQEALLPGVWMLLWGVGALAMGFFTPRVISLLGMVFLISGMVCLLLAPLNDVLAMGLTFGGIHLAYGFALTLGRHWVGVRDLLSDCHVEP